MPRKLDNEHLRKLLESWPELAVDYLFKFYKTKLLIQSEWKTHDPHASEDIVQEAITSIWTRREWILSQPNLVIENFLVRIIRNQSVKYYDRDRRPDENHLPNDVETADGAIGVDLNEDQNNEERDRLIWKLIDTFPLREKECLQLKYQKEMAIEDIAVRLGITAKGVEKNVTRAYKRLRQFKHLFSS